MIHDTRLKARAIQQRWDLSPEQRRQVLDELMKVVTESTNAREKISAARALLSAEAQNQSDEHKLLDANLKFNDDQISAIAADLRIDEALVLDAARAASLDPPSDTKTADRTRSRRGKKTKSKG